MTPTAKVRKILVDNCKNIPYLKAQHIHSYMIKPNDWSKTDCLLRISELPAGSHEYGNLEPINERKGVQIEFYYPTNYKNDMDLIEKKVKSILFAHRIRCYSDAGHVIAPDNQNIENTLKFNYIEEDL
ncbi:hypothetical protein LMB76_04010 [Limosilactobacillus reuteri]|jgi:hypothetical protein|uniref:Uncharacterized protein n=2 Tax=Limosilactobacillus reuteri TaxID=1598 RepID=B3XQ52_LIMR1|nr:hypothetical protein [Limosilactobacillus reuteri]EDX41653.1 hypothetical protein Lreu23DRAFT_3164 [Limosilactobacillus reuteri subsp. rodentium]MCC4475344.1 hypothetical protein [Limosilactobacillus reuteri]MCC4477383.1 hypothetical protein [Limosilactobacillus reuteri]MCC4479660.1 hypothetical protein [Limosilactobacillus reuteri]MCC4489034.1 hypothetical protein [Limosilactobacillus reuteri]